MYIFNNSKVTILIFTVPILTNTKIFNIKIHLQL